MDNSILYWKILGSQSSYRVLRTRLPGLVRDLRQLLRDAVGAGTSPVLDIVLFSPQSPARVLSEFETLQENSYVLVQRLRREEAAKLMEAANEGYKKESGRRIETQAVGLSPASDQRSTNGLLQPEKALGNSADASVGITGGSTASKVWLASHASQDPSSTYTLASGVSWASQTDGRLAVDPTAQRTMSPVQRRQDSLARSVETGYEAPGMKASTAESLYVTNEEEEAEEDRRIDAVMAHHAEHRGPVGYQRSRDVLIQRYNKNRNLRWVNGEKEGMSGEAYASSAAALPNVAKRPRPNPSAFSGYGQMPPSINTQLLPVSADYICHMCGEKGHHIKNCPKSQSNRHLKKIKPATGIPANFLRKITPNDIAQYNEVYILKDGQYAVMKDVESVSARAYFSKSLDQRVQQRLGTTSVTDTSAVDAYKCPMCYNLFDVPLITPCCAETYCKNCILWHLSNTRPSIHDRGRCPKCEALLFAEDLTLNKAVQDSLAAIIMGLNPNPMGENERSAAPYGKRMDLGFFAEDHGSRDYRATKASSNPSVASMKMDRSTLVKKVKSESNG